MGSSCYTCQNFKLCYFRVTMWDQIKYGAGLLSPDAAKDIYAAVAGNCKEYGFDFENAEHS